jgi:hypothetical protein
MSRVVWAVLVFGLASVGRAGEPTRGGVGWVVPRSGVVSTAPRSPYLGTFYPTPSLIIRDDEPAGKGYSPLGQYGQPSAMDLYGPISRFRSRTETFTYYRRGYNGVLESRQGVRVTQPYLRPDYPRPGLVETRAVVDRSGRLIILPPRDDSMLRVRDQY